MSLLVRPEPFSTEFNRLFNSLWDTPAVSQRWVPEMDLVETEDHYLLKADLPGMKQDDVSIEFNDGAQLGFETCMSLSVQTNADNVRSGSVSTFLIPFAANCASTALMII